MWHIRFPTCVAYSALFYIVQVVLLIRIDNKSVLMANCIFFNFERSIAFQVLHPEEEKDMFGMYISSKDFMIKDL